MQDVLEALAANKITVEEARRRLAMAGLAAVDDWALLDAEREARTGLPEVVLAEGKSAKALAKIVAGLLERRTEVLVSRLKQDHLEASGLLASHGDLLEYDEEAGFARFSREQQEAEAGGSLDRGRVAVVTAGTADRAVAKEAVLTLRAIGTHARLWVDRGIAAPARLGPTLQEVLEWDPDVVIVAAGREGTLATIVSGLVPVPVIGLPVSTGYGHAGAGEAALSAMLQSCSPLAVVNIDAGVQAGFVAARVAMRAAAKAPQQVSTPSVPGSVPPLR
jgi:pyridinium-3,5-biscarboxylic acid mononucleotide synthase